ncbi:galactosylceramidase [Streptomyces sp. So13.3]|uniref:RICIN domain-containing protein n=1 Tax=Streptomyces TaxID=1883 RepID=UPI001107502C|nr:MULTISPECIES: ricin-type beta-trefoil lectin domain protein [Streptomyces]MCZ4101257.1 RICIN domain-containing protein [Streptomyces sp. H39-C1]QNA77258.1 galactosylceramidase [Streptomyces sp. So13.3]
MRHLWRLAPLWVLALLATVLAVSSEPAQAATTSISVDGSQGGRTFDGIGAISGGGGNSRLLTDYPAAQQSQILDYMFKPGYGANLQLLKVEIGGDANSTDGSEPSIEHSRGTVNCNAGYEFWLAEQAKARNPDIGLYGLAWAAPGWINGGFWSTDTVNYLISWLDCAKQHNLTIKYLGGWNERGHDANWFVQLRSALNSHGYSGVQLVADDSGWGVADDMANNSAFNNAVSIIGAHYSCEGGDGGNAHTCSSTTAAKNNGKPLWDSENGSQDMNTGAPALIRSITRGYIDAKMTSYFNWPLIAAIYPNLPYNTVGLATAGSPWSGNYTIGASTWATAQVTQFTKPGWKFIDSASGYLGGTESNGTYVTVKSNTSADYSTILETTTSGSSQTANFTVKGGLSTGTVHVWATDVNSPSSASSFVHTQDITPNNGSYSLTMQPGYVYTVSTLGGQGKGTATAPAAHALALPYSDTFDGNGSGTEAKYLSDMQGSFEVQPCTGRSGQCVQQMAPVKPIEWQDDSDSYALIGDPTWSNYTVSSDVYLRGAGTTELLGRANTQQRPQSHMNAYYLRIRDTGRWWIEKMYTDGSNHTLATGTTTALGTGQWHNLSFTFQGSQISAKLDGNQFGSVTDSSFQTGQAGLGIQGYRTDQFDNLSITPGTGGSTGTGQVSSVLNAAKCLDDYTASTTPGAVVDLWDCNSSSAQQWTISNGSVRAAGLCLDVIGGATANGSLVNLWTCNGGANQQWTVSNGTLVNPASGRCLDIPGFTTTNGTQLEIWDCNNGSNQKWNLPL